MSFMRILFFRCIGIRCRVAALLAGLAWMGPAAAQEDAMRFSVFWPCSGNASFCAPRILAQGKITHDSAQRFARLVEDTSRHAHELPPFPTVVFDSPGGSLAGGIALGREIRRRGMSTDLAHEYDIEDRNAPDGLRVIVGRAKCASACVLAFSGGVTRHMSSDARMGVHQFSVASGQMGDSAAQVTMVKLAEYFQSMGVDRRLLDVAALVSPKDIAWMTLDDARALNLDNTSPPLEPWRIQASTSGTPNVIVIQPQPGDGKKVSVMITHSDETILLLVTSVFDRRTFDEDYLAYFPINETPEIDLCTSNRCIRGRSVAPWVRRDQGNVVMIAATTAISPEEAYAISRSTSLRVDDNFPRSLESLSVQGELSVKGLASGVALVLRSAGFGRR